MSIAINPYFAPVPVSGGQVLLNLKTGGKVVTQIDDTSQHFWTLLVRSAPPGVLAHGVVATVTYSDGKQMYTGACKVQSLAQGGRRLVIKAPSWFKSRPLRQFERYAISLPASLVLPAGDFCHFVPRTDARILNISEGGALLGLRQPLPASSQRLLLLTDTSQAIGHVGGNAYFSAKPVRQEQQSSNLQFPYSYGLSFGHLPPLYRQMLVLMINQIADARAPVGAFGT